MRPSQLRFPPPPRPRALRFVRDALSDAGYAALVHGHAARVWPRLVLLDLMLPDINGIA